ncbi:MAG: hypothetical protein H6811_02775 [Phycisphaeraceae bacterium]|nr:hypothetical protein [Phycisphaeraceae bacterium]
MILVVCAMVSCQRQAGTRISVPNVSPIATGEELATKPLSRATIAQLSDRVVQRALPQYRDTLGQAIIDTLTTYTAGNLSDWLAYLDTYGVEIPQFALSNPDAEEQIWRATREFFQSAMVSVEDVTLVGGYQHAQIGDGWNTDGTRRGLTRHRARRDQARAFLREIPEAQRTVAWVLVPGAFTGFNGDQFEAQWGIEFTRNPRTGRWVLTELVVMGDGDLPGVPSFLL